MHPYGTLPKETDNVHIRKGEYGRYGNPKTHCCSYLRCERAIKRRERNNAKMLIRKELTN